MNIVNPSLRARADMTEIAGYRFRYDCDTYWTVQKNKPKWYEPWMPDVVLQELVPIDEVEKRDDLLSDIYHMAAGHQRSTAYNDGVNIALENIANMILMSKR